VIVEAFAGIANDKTATAIPRVQQKAENAVRDSIMTIVAEQATLDALLPQTYTATLKTA
jgi:hypothetical protein